MAKPNDAPEDTTRRQMLAGFGTARSLSSTVALEATPRSGPSLSEPHTTGPHADKALVAITMDLEMSMHYPTWEQMEWNYEKGLLDQPSIAYVVEAARRVKASGDRMHNFIVARLMEEADVDWVRNLHQDGHHFGNHSYDHVYIRATKAGGIQPRFQRAPWLIYGRAQPSHSREY